MLFREAAQMELVNNGVVPRNPLLTTLLRPFESWIDNNTLRHEWRAISFVKCEIIHRLHFVPENRWVPFQVSGMRAGVGVEQQLVWIKSMPFVWLIRTMDTIPIDSSRLDPRQITMPDLIRILRQLDAFQLPVAILVE